MNYLYVITLLIASATALKGNLKHLLRHIDVTQTDLTSVEEKWIEQPLDHFDTNEKRTLKVKYFENLQFWKQNGPIYIFIGGAHYQNPIWASGNYTFLPAQLAKETNGALYASEHRYYGASTPPLSPDNTTEYYKFLSSHQALEDLASLIKKIKTDSKFKSSKVVVIGGAYAGNLAAWIRELHPELVDAAIASSAPVLAKKDFKEFLVNVRYTFGKYGTDDCLKNIEEDFKRIENLLKTAEGRDAIKVEMYFCEDSDLTVLENQETVFNLFKYDELIELSQSAFPHEIKDWCVDRQFSNKKSEVSKFDWCIILDLKKIPWAIAPWAPWIYQFCTEFGYLPTTAAEKQPFVHWGPKEFFLYECEFFVKGDAEKTMDEGIAKTNERYGGLTPNVTKVVFTHGDMDPWHTLGVLKDLGPDAPVTIVNGTSQCKILTVQPDEPKELKENRKYVKELIKKWIAE